MTERKAICICLREAVRISSQRTSCSPPFLTRAECFVRTLRPCGSVTYSSRNAREICSAHLTDQSCSLWSPQVLCDGPRCDRPRACRPRLPIFPVMTNDPL